MLINRNLKKKHRTVFGRRRISLEQAIYQLEMRKDCLVARELHSRREHSIPLGDVVHLLLGQLNLSKK